MLFPERCTAFTWGRNFISHAFHKGFHKNSWEGSNAKDLMSEKQMLSLPSMAVKSYSGFMHPKAPDRIRHALEVLQPTVWLLSTCSYAPIWPRWLFHICSICTGGILFLMKSRCCCLLSGVFHVVFRHAVSSFSWLKSSLVNRLSGSNLNSLPRMICPWFAVRHLRTCRLSPRCSPFLHANKLLDYQFVLYLTVCVFCEVLLDFRPCFRLTAVYACLFVDFSVVRHSFSICALADTHVNGYLAARCCK